MQGRSDLRTKGLELDLTAPALTPLRRQSTNLHDSLSEMGKLLMRG